MRLLITGALGFVGANLVRRLADSPTTTIIATDLREPDDAIQRYWAPVQQRIKVARLDVTQANDLLDLASQEGITHILHCAAITPSLEDERVRPNLVSTVNLLGTLNVLAALQQTDSVQRLLLMSSSGVYRMPQGRAHTARGAGAQISEDGPLALDNLYAITKYSAELLAARYRVLSGKDIASIRLGPFYGPLERRSPSRPHLSVPGRLFSALQSGQPLTIAGPDITRDWIYADDAANALGALLAAPQWWYDVYNLGVGRPISLREMVEAFEDQGLSVTWRDTPEEADIGMSHSHGRQTMSIRRISGDAGWQPIADPRLHVAEMCRTSPEDEAELPR